MSDQVTVTQIRNRCRHLHAAGHQCGSPSLRGRTFCYYHDATHRPYPNSRSHRFLDHNKMSFMLPVLEDHRSILLALSQIAARIAANDLDPLRAQHLLVAVRVASNALARESRDLRYAAHTQPGAIQSTPRNAPPSTASPTHHNIPEPVENPVFDPAWGPLAPDPDQMPPSLVYLEDPTDTAAPEPSDPGLTSPSLESKASAAAAYPSSPPSTPIPDPLARVRTLLNRAKIEAHDSHPRMAP